MIPALITKMYWTFTYNKERLISWGQPKKFPEDQISNLNADYSVKIYQGEEIKPEESVVFSMQDDATLGIGDSIWLITYLRDLYNIKGRRKCKLNIATSEKIAKFYSPFLPPTIKFIEEYITKDTFDSYNHKLPAMYYWQETDGADRSWLDNMSILERLYRLVGIEYEGLPDWSQFTPNHILYPSNDFYDRLEINKKDKYTFFQWHSSGEPKNIPPQNNIKLLRHITKKYNTKCYVVGLMNNLDALTEIPGVVNLSNKTTVYDVFSLAANADLIVCPDSAGIHLGEAYQIPTVAIMATLPPSYVANKYKIPAFMFGSGLCPHKPCGFISHLPIEDKCPEGTKDYCTVLRLIDLNRFDKCIEQTLKNRNNYRQKEAANFYTSKNMPILSA